VTDEPWRWSFHDRDGLAGGSGTRNVTVFFDGHADYIRYAAGAWDHPAYALND
jgi:hypothetical protein